MKHWTGERLETFIDGEVMVEHLHRYAIAQEYCKGKIVLDIASGEGYGSALLAKVATHVTGVDISKDAVEAAAAKYTSPNVTYLVGSADDIPLPDQSVAVVVSFETIEHLSNHTGMLAEIKRVLQPGGVLIISTPEKLHYSDIPNYQNPFHVKELYRNEFETLLQQYFQYQHLLFQKIRMGSCVQATDAASINGFYSGNYDQITHTPPGTDEVFLIAIASDQPLPAAVGSFFDGTAILKIGQQQYVYQTALHLKDSHDYRLGKALLWLPRLLKKWVTQK